MTPEELKEFREWCRTFEVSADSMIMKALTHIDQQAASLDEAEALIKKNAELMNGYLARIAELESQIIHQTGVSACRIEERERLQKQIAALQEIAVEVRAERNFARDYPTMPFVPGTIVEDDGTGYDTYNLDARRQLAKEHPEAFR